MAGFQVRSSSIDFLLFFSPFKTPRGHYANGKKKSCFMTLLNFHTFTGGCDRTNFSHHNNTVMFGFILRMIKAFFSKFQMINPFLEKQLSDDKPVPQNDFRMIKPFLKNELPDDKPVFFLNFRMIKPNITVQESVNINLNSPSSV